MPVFWPLVLAHMVTWLLRRRLPALFILSVVAIALSHLHPLLIVMAVWLPAALEFWWPGFRQAALPRQVAAAASVCLLQMIVVAAWPWYGIGHLPWIEMLQQWLWLTALAVIVILIGRR